MPIVLVQSTKKIVTAVNNTTLAFGSPLTAGNLALATQAQFVDPANTLTTPTDTLTHTFAPVGADQVITVGIGTASIRLNSFYKENCLGGADTVTFDIGGVANGDISCAIAEASGMSKASSILNQTAANASNGSAVATGTPGSTTQLSALVWGAMTHSGATTSIDETVGGTSGFQLVQEDENGSTNMPINVEYKIVNALGVYTGQWTLGAARDWACHVASFLGEITSAPRRPGRPFPFRPGSARRRAWVAPLPWLALQALDSLTELALLIF